MIDKMTDTNNNQDDLDTDIRDPSQPWGVLITDFTQTTTLHGIQYLGRETRYYIRRLIWTIILLTAGATFIALVSTKLDVLLQYKSSTTIEVQYSKGSEAVNFPSVTICNLNTYKQSELQTLALQDVIKVLDSEDYITEEKQVIQPGNGDHYYYIEDYCMLDLASDDVKWWKDYEKTTREVCAYMCSNAHMRQCSSILFNAFSTKCTLTSYDGYEFAPGPCDNKTGLELYIRERSFERGLKEHHDILCDFETQNCPGFQNDLSTDKTESWKIVTGRGNTPVHDATLESDRGHYLLFRETALRPDYKARYITQLIDTKGKCLEFLYRFLGTGCELKIYLKTTDLNEIPIYDKKGSGPKLYRGQTLDINNEIQEFSGKRINVHLPKGVFKVIIEGLRGSRGSCGIAIDDIRVQNCSTIDTECLRSGRGEHYLGTKNTTHRGDECLPWNEVDLPFVKNSLTYFPDSINSTSNVRSQGVCRNAFGFMEKPYCYYMEQFTKLTRAVCDIPMCGCNKTKGLFQCASGLCIPSSLMCDGRHDCDDGSDEVQPCENKIKVECDFEEQFACGYEINMYPSNISWVWQSFEHSAIQNSPSVDSSLSTIGYYLMVDNRQSEPGEKASFRSPYATFDKHSAISFSYYISTNADDALSKIDVFLISELGRRTFLLSLDSNTTGRWVSATTPCLPVDTHHTYAIAFEATIGSHLAGIAIDGIIEKNTCVENVTEQTSCNDSCVNHSCYISHTTYVDMEVFVEELGRLEEQLYFENTTNECTQGDSLFIWPTHPFSRRYTTTITSPVYHNIAEQQCIRFYYAVPIFSIAVELVTGVNQDKRQIIFQDAYNVDIRRKSISIMPQDKEYVINYIITLEQEPDGQSSAGFVPLPPDCSDMTAEDTDCSCSFTSTCDNHILQADVQVNYVQINEDQTISSVDANNVNSDKALQVILNHERVELSVLRSCSLKNERCFSFQYYCDNDTVNSVELALVTDKKVDSSLPLDSECSTHGMKRMLVELPSGDYAVVFNIQGGNNAQFILDNLRMELGRCPNNTGTTVVDLRNLEVPSVKPRPNRDTEDTEIFVPEVERIQYVTYGPELGDIGIMTKYHHDTSMEEVIHNVGHDASDMILSCTYDHNQCQEDDFRTTITDMGVCYSFNYNMCNSSCLKTSKTGTGSGLELLLNVQKYDHIDSPKTRSGVKVFLHDKEEIPFMTSLGQAVPTGVHSYIAIDREEASKLGNPYGECKKIEDSNSFYPDNQYTYYRCLRGCETDHLNSVCGCKNLYMPDKDGIEDCDIFNYFNCSYQHTVNENTALSQSCDCMVACDTVTYTGVESSSVLSELNVDYFLNFQRDEIDKSFQRALEIQYRTNKDSFNSTMNQLIAITNAHSNLKNYMLNDIVNQSSSYIGRFEEIIDKMTRIAKADILDGVFKNYTEYYDMYFEYQDNHWNGIADSLLALRRPLIRFNDALQLQDQIDLDWLETLRWKLCESLIEARTSVLLYNRSDTLLNTVDEDALPEADFLMTPKCRIKFSNLDIVLADMESSLSCKSQNMTSSHSLDIDTKVFKANVKRSVNIINIHAVDCTTDYHDFLVEFSDWTRYIQSSFGTNSPVQALTGFFSTALNVDSIYKFLVIHDDFFERLQANYSESALSITEISAYISDSQFKQRMRDLSDKKQNIYDNIFLPMQDVFEMRRSELKQWYKKTVELAHELGFRLKNDSQTFEADIKALRLWRKPLPTVDNPEGIYYEYAANDLKRSWPLGWTFDEFYSQRADYIIDIRLDAFFQTLDEMISEMKQDLEQHYFELENAIDDLKQDLDLIVSRNQIDGDFVMDNFLQMNIYFRELKYTTISQTPDYDIVSFFSDLGGFLGLLLGASCITICEFLDLIFYNAVVKLILRKTLKKEEKKVWQNGSVSTRC